MTTYVVTEKVVYNELYYVDANNPEEAVKKFGNEQGSYVPFLIEAQYVDDYYVTDVVEN